MSINKKFGHYRVISELGRGGMGVVYKAWEPDLERFVAIKVLADNLLHDDSLKQRFIREAKAMATINHPNVIQIHFIGEQSGQPFFAMEFIEGQSLGEILKKGTILTLVHAKNIIYQACEGLLSAHNKGLIHRDIKPDNIMITNRGLVKVVDFGIARNHKASDKLTNTGELIGTPGYLSPEVCVGQEIDIRADIFSLGVVFYEMLSGKAPFENDSPLGLMLEVVQSEIIDIRKINKKVDKKTARIINKMVEKSPDDRYQTFQQIINDIGKINTYIALDSIKSKSIIMDNGHSIKTISNEHTLVNLVSKSHKIPLFTTVAKIFNKPLVLISLLACFIVIGVYIKMSYFTNYPEDSQISDISTSQIMLDSNQSISTEKNPESLYSIKSEAKLSTENKLEINPPIESDETVIVDPMVNGNTSNLQSTVLEKNTETKPAIPPNNTNTMAANEGYNCIEVYKFKADRSNHTTKKLERAAKIPDELLQKIQFITVGEIIRGNYGLKAVEPKINKCPSNYNSLILTGIVTDYLKGNKTTRYLIGFGAGQQKFQVDLLLTNKKSKKTIAQGQVIDRKIGGLLGGTDDKGRFDFAEKISGFVQKSIGQEATLIQKVKQTL